MKIIVALLSVVVLQLPDAAAQHDRIMQAVRAAVTPALPYPDSDQAGAVPANNDTAALWMVRPLQPGDATIEVLANPLNEENQRAAERAMAQIQDNIESAQRRAEEQYERALAELKRTGKSQDVDGVSLSDEGVDGEKIDAESHVTIEVVFGQPEYRFAVRGRIEPGALLPFDPPHLDVVAHTYKQDPRDGPEHYAEAETMIFLGRTSKPQVSRRANAPVWDVIVKADGASMAVRIRGNQDLVRGIAAKSRWNQLLELLQ